MSAPTRGGEVSASRTAFFAAYRSLCIRGSRGPAACCAYRVAMIDVVAVRSDCCGLDEMRPRVTRQPGTGPAGNPQKPAAGRQSFPSAGRNRRPGPATRSTPSAAAGESRPSRSGPPRPGHSATGCALPACWRSPRMTSSGRERPGNRAPGGQPRIVPAGAGARPGNLGGLDTVAADPQGLRARPRGQRRRARRHDGEAAAPARPAPGGHTWRRQSPKKMYLLCIYWSRIPRNCLLIMTWRARVSAPP
jgi:hypothetical protein